jgi:D-alanine--poly(phosphoribitol) ligase subunit 2
MDIRAAIRKTIQDMAQAPLPGDDGESLFNAGVIDSFALVELLSKLEAVLGVQVPDTDLMPSRFETVNKMVAYFQQRM